MTMKTFEIREEGTVFALIEARTAESALNKAARQYSRRSCDYNGYVGPVTWRAFLPTEPYALASKIVKVRK
jgi:hypothetical protein